MGLFTKKGTCSFCGNANGSSALVSDGFMCLDCSKNCGAYLAVLGTEKRTVAEIKHLMKLNEVNMYRLNQFEATNQIEDLVAFDDVHSYLKIGKERKYLEGIEYPMVYDYKDILTYELLEDGESITSGGISGAVVGGILFGEAGAILGGITGSHTTQKVIDSLKIKITIKNMESPVVYINLLEHKTKSNTIAYRTAFQQAQKILSMLSVAIENSKMDSLIQQTSKQDKTEELRKYKALLDDGIISEDEFNAKKKQLLGL